MNWINTRWNSYDNTTEVCRNYVSLCIYCCSHCRLGFPCASSSPGTRLVTVKVLLEAVKLERGVIVREFSRPKVHSHKSSVNDARSTRWNSYDNTMEVSFVLVTAASAQPKPPSVNG